MCINVIEVQWKSLSLTHRELPWKSVSERIWKVGLHLIF